MVSGVLIAYSGLLYEYTARYDLFHVKRSGKLHRKGVSRETRGHGRLGKLFHVKLERM